MRHIAAYLPHMLTLTSSKHVLHYSHAKLGSMTITTAFTTCSPTVAVKKAWSFGRLVQVWENSVYDCKILFEWCMRKSSYERLHYNPGKLSLWVGFSSFKDLRTMTVQIVTKCTRTIFCLIALMNKPQCQFGVPAMLSSKLLNQIYHLVPPSGLTLQAGHVPLPFCPPGIVELPNRQASINAIRVLIPYLGNLLNRLVSVVWKPALRGGDPLPLVFPNSSLTKLLNECMPCHDICHLCLMTNRVR
jgi:hypothetical protein